MNKRFPARIVVDIDKLIYNIKKVQQLAPNSKVLAVVKGNAYNHGIIESSLAFIKAGAEYLGVAQPYEALKIRNYIPLDQVKVLTWLISPDADLEELVDNDIEIAVGNFWIMDKIAEVYNATGKVFKVHIKLDYSFGRDGFRFENVDEALGQVKELAESGAIEIVGLWSHFANADKPEHPDNQKLVDFLLETKVKLEQLGIAPKIVHIANSTTIDLSKQWFYDMVRPGLLCYGLGTDDLDKRPSEVGIKPALRYEVEVAGLIDIKAGEGVSYEHNYIAPTDETIGLLPIGYVDGFPKHGSGYKVYCARTGNYYEVIGTVCMDQIFIKNEFQDLKLGDIITIYGDEPLTSIDMAKHLGTGQIETIMLIGKNVPYYYENVSSLGELQELYPTQQYVE
jgi:alanine racemase